MRPECKGKRKTGQDQNLRARGRRGKRKAGQEEGRTRVGLLKGKKRAGQEEGF
jgi:hypothetical protein